MEEKKRKRRFYLKPNVSIDEVGDPRDLLRCKNPECPHTRGQHYQFDPDAPPTYCTVGTCRCTQFIP